MTYISLPAIDPAAGFGDDGRYDQRVSKRASLCNMHAGARASDDEKSDQTNWYHLERESQWKSLISDVPIVMVTVMRKMIVLVYIFVFGGGIIALARHPGGVVPARSAFLQKSSRRRRRREGQAAADRIAVSESAPEVRSVGRPIRWFPFWHIRMEGGRGRGRCAVVRSLYADR